MNRNKEYWEAATLLLLLSVEAHVWHRRKRSRGPVTRVYDSIELSKARLQPWGGRRHFQFAVMGMGCSQDLQEHQFPFQTSKGKTKDSNALWEASLEEEPRVGDAPKGNIQAMTPSGEEWKRRTMEVMAFSGALGKGRMPRMRLLSNLAKTKIDTR